jgi:large subunit ribosomal protein L29
VPAAYELRELDDDELEGRLTEYRRELLNLRFQLATGQLDNVTRLSHVRRDVARVLTVLRDREIALAEGRDAGPVISTRPARRPRPAEPAEPAQEVEDVEPEADAEADAEPTTDQSPPRPARAARRTTRKAAAEPVDEGTDTAHADDDVAVDEEDR